MSTRTEMRIRAVLEDDEGQRTEYTILTDNRDRIAYELLAKRRGWPSMDVAPFLLLAVCTWSALKRSGVKPYPDVDAFLDHLPIVEPVDENGDAAEGDPAAATVEVPPTTEAAASI